MHTTRSPHNPLMTLALFMILSVIVLAGCQPGSNPTQLLTSPIDLPEPTNTPLPTRCDPITARNDIGLTVLTLADGSQIYLGENTEIVFTPVRYCPGLEEHHIILKQGQVAVSSKLPEGKLVQINSPEGYLAQLGKTGLVAYKPDEHIFALSCSNEPCSLGVSAGSLITLTCGQSAVLDAAGTLRGPTAINTTELIPFGEWLMPQCALAPTPTDTPAPPVGTPNPAATATASCKSFQDKFPLTPCPTTNP